MSLAVLLGPLLAGAAPRPEIVHDITGKLQKPLDIGDKAGSVLIFYWHDCPICNSYAPEINRICAQYTNFAFYIVQIDPDLTAPAAQKHAHDYGFQVPVILDGTHRLAKLSGAKIAPEAVIFGREESVLYRGRIDNLYPSLNQRRAQATTHDLRDALDAIIEGKPIKTQRAPVGCAIQ